MIDWTSPNGLFSSFDNSYLQLPADSGGGGFLSGASNLFGGFSNMLGGGSPLLSLGTSLLGGLFAGNTDVSGAASNSQAGLDSSGTVIGKGNAKGGSLNLSSSLSGGVSSVYWVVGAVAIIFLLSQGSD